MLIGGAAKASGRHASGLGPEGKPIHGAGDESAPPPATHSEADKSGLKNIGLGDLIYNTTYNQVEVVIDAAGPTWRPLMPVT